MDLVFQASCLLAAAPWLSCIFLPYHAITQRILEYSSLIFAAVFSVFVLPRLAWWLANFAPPELPALARTFGQQDNFLLLWLYILSFDIVVYEIMHRQLLAQGASRLQIAFWALLTAACAPLGFAAFKLKPLLRL